jgi:hypothetical protein
MSEYNKLERLLEIHIYAKLFISVKKQMTTQISCYREYQYVGKNHILICKY